jgi:hypothetical protein
MALTKVGAGVLNIDDLYGFRNRIINGDMRIDQRNAGASVAVPNDTNFYTVDRWQVVESASSVLAAERVTDAPAGFQNSHRISVTTAGSTTATQLTIFEQRIEGFNWADLAFGTAAALPVTLSFWVKSSVTGSFSGSLRNFSTRSYPFSYEINNANTWEYKTIVVEGDTTGSWSTDNTTGMRLTFDIGSGSSRRGSAGAWTTANLDGVTGAASIIGTLGATWQITGVQLEKGTVATPFERRPFGTELALCQRYTNVLRRDEFPFSWVVGHNSGGTGVACYSYPVLMRASPTVTQTGNVAVFSASSALEFSSLGAQTGPRALRTLLAPLTGFTLGHAFHVDINTGAFITISSEL